MPNSNSNYSVKLQGQTPDSNSRIKPSSEIGVWYLEKSNSKLKLKLQCQTPESNSRLKLQSQIWL